MPLPAPTHANKQLSVDRFAVLSRGQVVRVFALIRQAAHAHLFGNADYRGTRHGVGTDADALADGFAAWPDRLCHSLAHHYDGRRGLAVGLVECASTQHPRTHRREIVRRSGLQNEGPELAYGIDPGDVQSTPLVGPEGYRRRKRRVRDPRNRLRHLEQPRVEGALLRFVEPDSTRVRRSE